MKRARKRRGLTNVTRRSRKEHHVPYYRRLSCQRDDTCWATAVMRFSCLCAHYLGMHIVFWVALSLSAALCLIHVITICVAVVRCRPKRSLREKRFDALVTV